ncbi:lipopolysaccharide biosynthesis protein [Maribacter sp. Hel_I_7]|uniref:lipopolysaccharide biosynthesis protein n=1 Tax=Maribacter sp. Hel_I_7 TaxID=1249997 RepID=UPI00047DCC89|nr:oligosaccharide flippase family protein [Maribacter sp. Hel_I_7]
MNFKKKSLFLNFSGYTIINLLNSLTPFIILPILTWNLSSNDIGVIDLFTTSTFFLTPIIGLCIIQSISKLYFTIENRNKYISVVFTCILILGVGSTLLSILGTYTFNIFDLNTDKKQLVILIVFYVFLNLIIEGFLILKRNEENLKQFAIIRLSKAGLDIILSIIFLSLYNNYNVRIFSLFSSSFLSALFIGYLLLKDKSITFLIDKKLVNKILIYSSPLILHTFFNNILNYADRYFINDYLGTAQLGKYSVIYQLCMVMSLLITSFSMAWTPYFMKNMAIDKKGFMIIFNKTFKYYSLSILIFGIIIYFIMPLIYKFYVGEDYKVENTIYLALLSGYFFQGLYRFKVNQLFFEEKTGWIASLSFISALINIILNFYLIPKWGLFGAAFATLVSYIVLYTILELLLSKILNEDL